MPRASCSIQENTSTSHAVHTYIEGTIFLFWSTTECTKREDLSVDEVTASANEVTSSANKVTGKTGFIGRDNMACMYRELG